MSTASCLGLYCRGLKCGGLNCQGPHLLLPEPVMVGLAVEAILKHAGALMQPQAQDLREHMYYGCWSVMAFVMPDLRPNLAFADSDQVAPKLHALPAFWHPSCASKCVCVSNDFLCLSDFSSVCCVSLCICASGAWRLLRPAHAMDQSYQWQACKIIETQPSQTSASS